MSSVSVLCASTRKVLATRSTSSPMDACTLALLMTEDLAALVDAPVLTDSAAVLLSPDCWPRALITTSPASMSLWLMKAVVTGRSTLSATVPAAAAATAPKATAAAMTWLSVDAALVAVSNKEPAVVTDERLPSGASIQASAAGLRSTEAVYEQTRRQIAAQVARAYFTVIEQGQQLDLDRKSLERQRQTFRITQTRFDAGSIARDELVLGESRLATAEDNILASEGRRVALALLMETDPG